MHECRILWLQFVQLFTRDNAWDFTMKYIFKIKDQMETKVSTEHWKHHVLKEGTKLSCTWIFDITPGASMISCSLIHTGLPQQITPHISFVRFFYAVLDKALEDLSSPSLKLGTFHMLGKCPNHSANCRCMFAVGLFQRQYWSCFLREE